MQRSSNYTRTEATAEPVTTDELRTQLKLDDKEDDGDLYDFLTEARQECETIRLGDVSLIDAVCIDYFDAFADEMELHWSPVDSVTSIAYLDTNGASQTLATTVYELGTRYGMGIVRLKYNQTWPNTRVHPDVITITYTAGYGTAKSSVPKGIRRWIKARAAWLYENRDGVEFEWSRGMDAVLSPYATGRVHAQ